MALSPKRKHRVTGSQAGAILGLSPFMSREDVMQEWLHGSTFTGNAATEYGTFHEDYALADLCLETSEHIEKNEEFFIHPDWTWLGATPDGFIGTDAVVEIKCPFNLRDKEEPDFKSINDMPHYYAQIQIEMFCTGRKRCYFYQWTRTHSQLEIVDFDQQWFDDNLVTLRDFIADFESRKASISDDEQLAAEYIAAKQALDDAKSAVDKIKSKMIERADGKKRKFGSLSVYPVHRKGSVALAQIIKDHLPDFDIEPYRGAPSTSWVVK